jgi:hypothetical protein
MALKSDNINFQKAVGTLANNVIVSNVPEGPFEKSANMTTPSGPCVAATPEIGLWPKAYLVKGHLRTESTPAELAYRALI